MRTYVIFESVNTGDLWYTTEADSAGNAVEKMENELGGDPHIWDVAPVITGKESEARDYGAPCQSEELVEVGIIDADDIEKIDTR